MERPGFMGHRYGQLMKYLTMSWCSLALLLSTLSKTGAIEDPCGGYYDIGTGSQTFYSPDYPNSFPVGSHCVWIIQAGRDYRVKFTFSFTGARYNGNCVDYIEIRDGGPDSSLLGTYCDTHASVELMSSNIWLYVKLKSDQIAPSVTESLTATASAYFNSSGVSDVTNQVPDCRSYEFECANRVCISMSYRCDTYNDCGCLVDCDEDGCGSLPINFETQIGISVAVGVVVFIFICFITRLFEGKNIWMAHKTEAKKRRGKRRF